jgi:hypothetical protein
MSKLNLNVKDTLFPNIPKNAKKCIEVMHERLEDISTHFIEPVSLTETLSELSEAIDKGDITDDELLALNMRRVTLQKSQQRQEAAFYMSCIAYIQAKKLVTSGDEVDAWPLLCHTSYLIGQAETVLAVLNEALSKKENAKPGQQKGGRVTKEKYDKIRTRMIELLQTCTPAGGWISQKQAIDVIHDELQAYVAEASLGLALPDIYETATNWLSDNAEIKEVYLANAAKQ